MQIVGEELCEALDLRSGQTVLDVAAGNGNVTLAAARRWCDVTSTDYVPALLERGRARAAAEGLTSSSSEADAEALPFVDGGFDAVVSTFGVMFTANQDKAAAELLRVCKPGGKIGLANWTPDGFIGQLFKTLGKHVPPPAGVKSPALWGTQRAHRRDVRRAGLGDRRSRRATSCSATARRQHWMDVFKTYYGPMLKAFAALDAAGAAGPARRHHGADRADEPLRRRHDGGAERIPRDRHHQAVTFCSPRVSRNVHAAISSLTRRSIFFAWMAGSSPAMTQCASRRVSLTPPSAKSSASHSG